MKPDTYGAIEKMLAPYRDAMRFRLLFQVAGLHVILDKKWRFDFRVTNLNKERLFLFHFGPLVLIW